MLRMHTHFEAVITQFDVACGEHDAVKGMSSGKGYYFLVFIYEKHFENEQSATVKEKVTVHKLEMFMSPNVRIIKLY